MKILFVVNNFNFGGPQKSLLNLLYELEDKDVEVDLMILNDQKQLAKFLPSYVNVIKVPSKYALLMLSKEKILQNIIKNMFHPILNIKVIIFLAKSLLKLQENVKAKQRFWIKNKWKYKKQKEQYDYAIAVSGGHSIYFVVDYIIAKTKIGWIRTDYRVLKRDNNLDFQYFEKLDGILSVSTLCSEIFEDIFEIKPKVFYNSLPIKLYENIKSENIDVDTNFINICTVCRLDNGKGLDLLIEAATKLKERKLSIRWYVVGTGKLEKWLTEKIKDNELEDLVIPLGFIFNTGSVIQNMDFLVHPSRFEGKSNTIDEALYYNKPVIATNFETVYEQIENGFNGFIVSMDGNEIANKIIEMADNKKLIRKIEGNIISQKSVNKDSKGYEFIKIIKDIRND